MKIFVSIVSYRDPLLHFTLESLIANKSRKHEAKYSILEQTCLKDSLEKKYPELIKREDVIYKRIDPIYADGVGWARAVNALNVRDEDFFYQIDSHMLFDPNWDRMLVEDYKKGAKETGNDKVIVTGSCKVFTLNEEGIPVWDVNCDWTCEVKYFEYRKDTELLSAHGDVMGPKGHVSRAIHICAGNFFTHAAWLKNVGINNKIFFEGEEQFMTLSSFEAGYRMFHPRRIGCFHFRDTAQYVTKQWFEPVINIDEYGRRVWASITEWKTYLHNIDEDVLKDYFIYSGVDYINQEITPRARSNQGPRPPEPEADK